ncbi:tyrosine-type recombinase/integrase [Nonomuraea sp. NPDC050227]|uniref:tyrosine-type recombinase/integrase n=1 Tax=Nonomuraea sp. NPDC050227 TaxID=3364360 RepID=UPI00379C3E7B
MLDEVTDAALMVAMADARGEGWGLRKIGTSAGIPHEQVRRMLTEGVLRRHDLRQTGLTWMADAGVPLHVLRKIAGHGSLTTTQRYLHPDLSAIAEAGNALSAHMAGTWSPSGPQLRVA